MDSSFARKRRILVIDDDPGMTTLCRCALEKTGAFVVREENDARRARVSAREFWPHLIFLDVHLPGRRGEEIAGELAADPALSRVPIVFLTGDVDAAVASSGRPVLLKPTRADELIDTCQAWALGEDI